MFNKKEYLKKYQKQYWQNKPAKERRVLTKKSQKLITSRRHRNKEEAVEMLGGKCQRCGYNKCIAALEFHHKDPDKKDMNVSSFIRCNWKKLAPELKKCELVCANCHREIHWKLSKQRRL